MAVNLFFFTVQLGVTGSVGYILLKLLATVSGSHLSQSWRYHSIVAVSLLFVLPVHRLWALMPVPHNFSLSAGEASSSSGSVPLTLSPAGAGILSPGPLPNAGMEWGTVIEWAAALWFFVALGLGFWNVWKLLRYRRLIEQTNVEVSSHLYQIAVEEAHLAGIYDKVRLLASPLALSPMLVGFFHPTILLPSAQVPDSDARFIFAHELTHFQRKDMWKKLLVLMVQCIHWFNPIAYLLNRDFACWLETSCDEYVVSSFDREQRKEYGRLLINYAPTARYAGPKLYVSFTSCRYKLKRRILTMLNSNKKSRSLLGLVLALALIAGCLATSAFAAANDGTSNTNEISGEISDMPTLSAGNVASVDRCDSRFGQISDVVEVSNADDISIVVNTDDVLWGSVAELHEVDDAAQYADVTPSNIVLPAEGNTYTRPSGETVRIYR